MKVWLDVAKELKKRKARRVFVAATFGLFTNGMSEFDKYYEMGLINKVLTSNVIYQSPELLSREYYINVDLSKYIALLIDSINHDHSISQLLDPYDKIDALLEKYRKTAERKQISKNIEKGRRDLDHKSRTALLSVIKIDIVIIHIKFI